MNIALFRLDLGVATSAAGSWPRLDLRLLLRPEPDAKAFRLITRTTIPDLDKALAIATSATPRKQIVAYLQE